MTPRPSRRGAAVIALLGALTLSAGASAAAPWWIMVSGPGLRQPVLLGLTESQKIMQSVAYGDRVPTRQLAQRPHFLLSLFWEDENSTEPPTDVTAANQRGWFYPAYGERPAAFVVVRSIPGYAPASRRRAASEMLTILRRHGVPTRCAIKRDYLRACA
jgi:hypothetical protein